MEVVLLLKGRWPAQSRIVYGSNDALFINLAADIFQARYWLSTWLGVLHLIAVIVIVATVSLATTERPFNWLTNPWTLHTKNDNFELHN